MTDVVEFFLQSEIVESFERKAEKETDSPIEQEVGVAKGSLILTVLVGVLEVCCAHRECSLVAQDFRRGHMGANSTANSDLKEATLLPRSIGALADSRIRSSIYSSKSTASTDSSSLGL